jgi:hypothetical protein
MPETYDELLPGQVELREYLTNREVDGPLNDTEPYYTGQQRKWLGEWLRTCADRLLLNAWTFRLYHYEPVEGSHAAITCTVGRYMATITFQNNIFTEDWMTARQHMAHELMHVVYEHPTQMIENDLERIMGSPAHGVFSSAFRREMEFATDHMSMVVTELLPPPPWRDLDIAEITRHSNTTAQDEYRARIGEPTDGKQGRQAEDSDAKQDGHGVDRQPGSSERTTRRDAEGERCAPNQERLTWL